MNAFSRACRWMIQQNRWIDGCLGCGWSWVGTGMDSPTKHFVDDE